MPDRQRSPRESTSSRETTLLRYADNSLVPLEEFRMVWYKLTGRPLMLIQQRPPNSERKAA